MGKSIDCVITFAPIASEDLRQFVSTSLQLECVDITVEE